MSPDYGLSVAEAFQDYLQTGDSGKIKQFSAKELKTAISRLSPYYNTNKKWYREIERRLTELEREERSEQERMLESWQRFKNRWADKIISFSLGFLVAVWAV